MSKNAHGSTNTQAFGQRAENFPYAMRGGLEPVQDRAVADAELCLAGLALETRSADGFMAAAARPAVARAPQRPKALGQVANDRVATTTDKGVELIIGNAEIEAVGVWAGVPSRHDVFLAAAGAFYL